MKKIAFLLVPLLALVLAACSTADETVEPQASIADLVGYYTNLSTLEAAVGAAGLAGTLDDDAAGPFTLFAPSNEAIDNVIAAVDGVCEGGFTAGDLLANPLLGDILLYHAVSGKVMAEDVVALDGVTVDTLLSSGLASGAIGDPGITVGVNGGVTLTDALPQTVNVVKTDYEATNGVVHFIDAVLVPVPAGSLEALCPAPTAN